MLKGIFYAWWVVFACFLISFYVGSVIFFGFTAFIEPLIDEFGWSYTQISFAASLRGLEIGIFAPLVGFLVDRFGSRKLIFLGTVIVGLGLILLSFTRSLAMFYGSFLLISFGAGGCVSVVTMTSVANWFQKRVGMALGVMMSGFGASGLLIPLIVYLIEVCGSRSTLVILGLGMWALGTPLSWVIRNTPEECGFLPDVASPNHHILSQEPQGEEVEVGLREVIKKPSYWYLNVAEAVRMMALAAVVTHVMPYLSNTGMARTSAGLVAAAIPLCSIIGRFGLGWLADIFEKRKVLALSFFIMSLGMLAFSYPSAMGAAFLFLVLFCPGFGGSIILRGALLREYFGRDSLGKMLGVIMGSASLGGIIAPTIAGWAFDTTGSYQSIWLAFCGLIGLTIILVFRIR